ncbi:hypothetical protein HYC85_020434 [Camellia sinensis]|uniref:Uncharacterized protein n=1 Tax=Camellia sinensis TaxID=4442 RepID=A0A7J7GPS1_CAMSI|nr:hypothetical protein HYC85_020434 [Camellia sinensis]
MVDDDLRGETKTSFIAGSNEQGLSKYLVVWALLSTSGMVFELEGKWFNDLVDKNSVDVDWRRSFYLNLIAHTSFSVTVAICSHQVLRNHQSGEDAPLSSIYKVVKTVYASPSRVDFHLDSTKEVETTPAYPDICFAVDDFDSTFDAVEYKAHASNCDAQAFGENSQNRSLDAFCHSLTLRCASVLTDTDHCYCVLLNADGGAAFPSEKPAQDCSSSDISSLRTDTGSDRQTKQSLLFSQDLSAIKWFEMHMKVKLMKPMSRKKPSSQRLSYALHITPRLDLFKAQAATAGAVDMLPHVAVALHPSLAIATGAVAVPHAVVALRPALAAAAGAVALASASGCNALGSGESGDLPPCVTRSSWSPVIWTDLCAAELVQHYSFFICAYLSPPITAGKSGFGSFLSLGHSPEKADRIYMKGPGGRGEVEVAVSGVLEFSAISVATEIYWVSRLLGHNPLKMASSSRGLLTLFPDLNESTGERTGAVAREPQPNTSGFAPLNFPMRSVEQKMAVQSDVEANQYTLKSCVETMTAVTNLSNRLQSRANEVQQLNSQLALLQRMYKDARAEISVLRAENKELKRKATVMFRFGGPPYAAVEEYGGVNVLGGVENTEAAPSRAVQDGGKKKRPAAE